MGENLSGASRGAGSSGDTRDCDVLVVGGGIAGLTAAAYLCRAGLAVSLCEKESRTGGLVNSFEFKGFVFDGGIRSTENAGIVLPMLGQLGIEVELLPSPVSIGIGKHVVRVTSRKSLAAYRELLERYYPESRGEIARIVREIEKVMGYLDVLYGIDNPLFLDLARNPGYVFRTILPWLVRYLLATPKIAGLGTPVDDYLGRFTANRALVDIIAQHFFQQTPASFALSYFSIYLDYRYPRGGTGVLSQALDRYVREHGGAISTGIEITGIDPGQGLATDSAGGRRRYRRMVWAADQQALYRRLDLSSLGDGRSLRAIRARQQALAGRTGGDSVFTLYLTTSLDPAYFEEKASGHFFYTPSPLGLSNAGIDELRAGGPGGFVADKSVLFAWLRRFLQFNTYEISIPVLRDSRLAPAGKTGLIVSLLFDYSLAKHIRAMGWYDEFRQFLSEGIVDALESGVYPGLRSARIDSFTSTPLTIERITGNTDGAITGWSFTNDWMPAVSSQPRVASSVLTPVPGVYQAGQWTFSPAGMPISILTGKLAADRVIRDLA
jgi:phytoene dehydrogenase-like protein